MKITKKINNRKKTLLISAATLLILIISASFYVFAYGGDIFGWKNDINSSNKTDASLENSNAPEITAPSTSDQIDAGSAIKKDSVENSKNTNPTEPTQTDKTAITVTATQSESDETIRIKTIIDTITNTGTCTLEMTQDSTTIKRQAEIQALSSYSTCKGFEIPTSQLNAGLWDLKVSFTNSTHSGSSTIKFTVE